MFFGKIANANTFSFDAFSILDPQLKAHIREQLANTRSPHYIDIEVTSCNNYDYQQSKIYGTAMSTGNSGVSCTNVMSSNAVNNIETAKSTLSTTTLSASSSKCNYDTSLNAFVTKSIQNASNASSPILRYKTSNNNVSYCSVTTSTTTLAISSSSSSTLTTTTSGISTSRHQHYHHQQQQNINTNHSRNSSSSSAKTHFYQQHQIVENNVGSNISNNCNLGLINNTTGATVINSASGQLNVSDSAVGAVSSHSPTSPTNRPSRIPQAVKSPPKSMASAQQHTSNHKRPRPSQIPTTNKTGGGGNGGSGLLTNANANVNVPSPIVSVNNATTNTNSAMHILQHSNSYGGTTSDQITDTSNNGNNNNKNYYHQHHYGKQYSQVGSTTTDRYELSEPISAPPQPTKAPRFEAYMMTGDLILNLSRTPQSGNLLSSSGHAKKVDSLLRDPLQQQSAVSAPHNRMTTARTNGAMAPKASGESSPTSSSSVDSPMHLGGRNGRNELHQQQQRGTQSSSIYHRPGGSHDDSLHNNSNELKDRKDSLATDTLVLCDELERDDDVENNIDEQTSSPMLPRVRRSNMNELRQKDRKLQRNYNKSYDYEYDRPVEDYDEDEDINKEVENQDEEDDDDDRGREGDGEEDEYEEEEEEDELPDGELENEEDQTNYDITNLETYNSGGAGDGSDRSKGGIVDEDSTIFTYNNAFNSTKQRLDALKQKALLRYAARMNAADTVDCIQKERHIRTSCSTSSSSTVATATATVTTTGANVSTPDETSFSVPTSPTSLSTPLLLDKETANSLPTSPEPSMTMPGLGSTATGGGGCDDGGVVSGDHRSSNVVRRHNGIVRKCDSSGFRTSKSEDHLQQMQREGIAAVIPIDIDEDVNSSLNTLLDTRPDSEDSQV